MTQLLSQISKINDTTYKIVANDRKEDRLEVIIGDDKQPDFKPQVKLQRWDNEVNASFRYVDNDTETPTVTRYAGKIKYKKTKKEIHFYNLSKTETLMEGGFECEVILNERPPTNKIEFTIQSKDVIFYYQPPLTQKEIKRGSFCPENVEGSYAIYTKTPKINWKGGKLYRAGKVGHIYRPKIIDNDGNWTWGKLNIDKDKGILTITIEQNFLDTTYPIRIDPTFGYTTIGGYSSPGWDLDSSKFKAPENGTISSISTYLDSASGFINFGYYNDNSGVIGTHVAHGTAIYNPGTTDWKTIDVSGSITADNYYWLVVQQDTSSIYDFYDSGDTNQEGYDTSFTFNTWSDNPTIDHYYSYIISIYATYATTGQDLTQDLSDTLTLSESLKHDVGVNLSDTLTLAESLAADISMVLSDSLGMSESISTQVGVQLTESLGLSESLATALGLNVELSDTLTLSEALDTAAEYYVDLADSLILSESLASDIQMYLQETLGLSESISVDLTKAIIEKIRKRYISGLKPARVNKVGRIGV